MKKSLLVILLAIFIVSPSFSQETSEMFNRLKGHYNNSKFKQLNEELPTPNNQHPTQARGKYIIDAATLQRLRKDAVVLHPLPRVDEVRGPVGAGWICAELDAAESQT